MPRGKTTKLELPAAVKVEFVHGEPFVAMRAAACLAGLHPVVLEMGQRLLKRPEGEGAVFKLATPDLQKRADDIEQMVVAGLRKVARAFGTGPVRVKSFRDADRLVFWYQATAGTAAK